MSKETEFIRLIRKISFEYELKPDDVIEAFEESLKKATDNRLARYKEVYPYIDREKGTLHIFVPKKVVKRLKDPDHEILISDLPEPDKHESGDIVKVEIEPQGLDRLAAQALKTNLPLKLQEIKKQQLLAEFQLKIGHLVQGEVQKYDQKNYYILLGKVTGLIPRSEFPPTLLPRIGESMHFLIVKILEKVQGGPYVILSRTRKEFIIRLFEREVPEVREGIVEIKSVARDVGNRAKIAVVSYDKNVDPVGACVGVAGKRIQEVVKELRGEKIDVVVWNEDLVEFIKNAFHPAEIKLIEIDEEENIAHVIVKDENLSLAIGKKGQNAKLTAILVGYRIEIKGESEFTEFFEEKSNQMMNFLNSLGILTEDEIKRIMSNVTYRLEKLPGYSAQEISELGEIDINKSTQIIESSKQILTEEEEA